MFRVQHVDCSGTVAGSGGPVERRETSVAPGPSWSVQHHCEGEDAAPGGPPQRGGKPECMGQWGRTPSANSVSFMEARYRVVIHIAWRCVHWSWKRLFEERNQSRALGVKTSRFRSCTRPHSESVMMRPQRLLLQRVAVELWC